MSKPPMGESYLATLHERPVELLQSLIRFDTTNPPGNEAACISYVDDVLTNIISHEPGPPEPDMGLFDTLADILREADPGSTLGPLVLAGVTDARHFSRLGIHTYGFTPMKMPPDLNVWRLAHGTDEHIPVDSMEFGTESIYKLLHRFGEAS